MSNTINLFIMELFNAGEIEDTLIVPVDQLTLDNGLVKDFGGNSPVQLAERPGIGSGWWVDVGVAGTVRKMQQRKNPSARMLN